MKNITVLVFISALVGLSLQWQRQPPSFATTTLSEVTTTAATTAAAATTTEEYDDYMTLAMELIDSDSCPDVESNGNCYSNSSLTSYFGTFTYNGKRVIVTSGVPDHDAEEDMVRANENRRCEKWAFMSVPLDVGKGDSYSSSDMGPTGLAVTGGLFYGVLSNTDGSLAAYNEIDSLDSCFGHSETTGEYHYHANINCTEAGAATGANDPDQCILIGYMRDGVPLYGFCKDSDGVQYTSCYSTSSTTDEVEHVSGSYWMASTLSDYSWDSSLSGCNLDEANGAYHPTTEEYSYFMTNTFPFVPPGYYGEEGVSETTYCGLGV